MLSCAGSYNYLNVRQNSIVQRLQQSTEEDAPFNGPALLALVRTRQSCRIRRLR